MAKRKRKRQGIPGLPNPTIINGEPDDMMAMFMRYMVESHILADEPEFINFRFDPDKAYASAEKTHKKHARALRAAEKKGGEELEFLEDDMRMEAIERLLTPPIRRDIFERMDCLVNRLEANKSDFDKLMMATALQSVFEVNELPWGVTNLITELFRRSLEIPEPDPEVEQIFEQVQALIGEDLGAEELLEQIDDPEFIKELEAKIDTDSEIYQSIARQIDNYTEDFINAIFNGQVELDLFTEAELITSVELIQERLLAAGLDTAKTGSPEIREMVQAAINDSIQGIVTPERLKTMKKELLGIFESWSKDRNKFAGPLLSETRSLDHQAPSENLFINVLLVSQLKRISGGMTPEEHEPTIKPKRRRRRRRKK